MAEVSFPVLVSPAKAKRKETYLSSDQQLGAFEHRRRQQEPGAVALSVASANRWLRGMTLNYRWRMVAKEAFWSKSPIKRLHGWFYEVTFSMEI